MPPLSLEPGTLVLDRYRIERVLGRGGGGSVYRAAHDRLGMPVAVKVLSEVDDQTAYQRFEAEAKFMARIRHPNVVQILDYGLLDKGLPCIVMEYLEGPTLRQRSRGKALLWQDAVGLTLGALGGLEALHAQKLLHRDLKPGNIMIIGRDPEVVKLIDLGIARSTEADAQNFTRTRMAIGTPRYMSPEQIIGSALDARSDIYSLGLILFEMLTAQAPFGVKSASEPEQRLFQPAPPPVAPSYRPPLPPRLQALVQSALAPNRHYRPPSARYLIDELRQLTNGSTRAEQPFEPTEVIQAPSRPLPGVTPSPPAAPEAHTTPLTEAVRRRGILTAKLPASRLALPDERKWLAALVSRFGRGFNFGAQTWFAVLSLPEGKELESTCARLGQEVASRYGSTTKVLWTSVPDDFKLSPASLTGALPLPEELQDLFEQLMA